EDANAVRAKDIGDRGDFLDVRRGEDLRVGIDVRECRAIDADGCVGARVVLVAWREFAGERVPLPKRLPGVSTLDTSIEVVPVVQHAELDLRRGLCEERPGTLSHLQLSQELKDAVQHTELRSTDDHGAMAT